MQVDEVPPPNVDEEPAGQSRHPDDEPAVEYCPIAQGVHSAWIPPPAGAEVPAAQDWHPVFDGLTEYRPTEQIPHKVPVVVVPSPVAPNA